MSFSESEESATFLGEDKYYSDTNDKLGEEHEEGADMPDEYYEENFKRILGTSLQKSVAEAVAPLQSSILKMQKSFAKQKAHYESAIKLGGKKASQKRKHCEVSTKNLGSSPSQSNQDKVLKQKMAKCFSVKTDNSTGKPRAIIKSTVVHDTTSDTTSSESDSDSDSSLVPKKKKRMVVNNLDNVNKDKDKIRDEDVFIPEDIRHPKSNEWYTQERVNNYLLDRIRKPLDKEVRARMRSECPRPFSEEKIFDTPEIDAKIITFAGRNARDLKRGIDRAWRGCQDRLLDAIGPLAKIMDLAEEAKVSNKPIDHTILSGWAQRAICFLGNANCSLSAERRKSILLKISPKMMDLAVNEPGGSAKGFLFGDEFVKEMAKYANSFQSMQKSKTSIQRILSNKVFDRAGRGRGRSTGRSSFQSSRGNYNSRGSSQYGSYNYQSNSPFYPTRARGQRGRRGFQKAIEPATGELNSNVLCENRGTFKRIFSSVGRGFIRSLDFTGKQGFFPRVYSSGTCSTPISSASVLLGTGSKDDSFGVDRVEGKIGHYSSRSSRGGFCEQHLSGDEQTESSSGNKFERTQPVYCLSPFQNGRYSPSPRPSSSRRLFSQIGSKGCLSGGADPSISSEISKIQVGIQNVAVSMSPIRSFFRSLDFHQTTKTGSKQVAYAGNSSHYLHRRHITDGIIGKGTLEPHRDDGSVVGKLGIFNKSCKVTYDSSSTSAVSRIYDRYTETDTRASIGENKADPQRDSMVSEETGAFHSTGSKDCRPAIIIHPGHIPGTPILQSTSKTEDSSSSTGLCLPSQNSPGCRFSRRIELVASTYSGMERQSHIQLGSGLNYRIGRQQFRLGSSLRRSGNRRDVVLSRISSAHKLSRTFGGFIRHKIFGKRQDSVLYPLEDGQCIGGQIHQQVRRNSLKSPGGSGKKSMAILPESQSIPDVTISSRTSQCHSGLVVSESSGLQRLEASPVVFSEDSSNLGPISPRPFCVQIEHASEEIFQLASGSESSGHGCISSGMGNRMELCVSPIRDDSQSNGNDTSDPGEGCSYYPPLDVSALDSSSSGTFFGFSDSSASPRQHSQQSTRSVSSISTGAIPDSGGVETIGILRGMSLLSEQSKLFINRSWASGTRRIYESSWKQWNNWCLGKDEDPFSADVSYILNFLAEKASDGYKYRSINVFRSAISAGHEFVAKVPVGEHPLVCRLMRGIRLSKPPLPKYKSFWDVNRVLEFFLDWPDNSLLSLKQLSAKLACLLCLISCKRVSDVKALDISGQTSIPEGLSFNITSRTKTNLHSVFYPAFQTHPKLCAVKCILDYEDRTATYRQFDQLILTIKKPFKPATTATMARWIRWILKLTGVDTSKFGAHSLRGAMASKQRQVGVSLKDIILSADWSSDSIFKQFYCKPIEHTALAVIQRL